MHIIFEVCDDFIRSKKDFYDHDVDDVGDDESGCCGAPPCPFLLFVAIYKNNASIIVLEMSSYFYNVLTPKFTFFLLSLRFLFLHMMVILGPHYYIDIYFF